MDTAIARLVAAGIPAKMKRDVKAWAKLPSWWTIPTDNELQPLALVHLMFIFILCLGGLSLSLIVFVLEYVLHKSILKKSGTLSSKTESKLDNRANNDMKDVILPTDKKTSTVNRNKKPTLSTVAT